MSLLALVRDTLAYVEQERGPVKRQLPPVRERVSVGTPQPPVDDAKTLLGKVLPGVTWKEAPGARRTSGVAIVYADEGPDERALLERLAAALQREGKSVALYRAPTAVPACDLLLVTRAACGRGALPDTQRLVIEDVSLYVKTPAARRELWDAILRHVG